MHNVLCVILGGGRGTRLYPLTKFRSKPAVPIGGKYRLIDIPISNCLHSGIDHIYVLTQFNTASLHRHISRTYVFDAFSNGFVDILAAEQTQESMEWYQGTADAVRQHLRHILHGRYEHTLILSGDHLYRMDYRPLIQAHQESDADITLMVKRVDRKAAGGFGILKMDGEGHIVDFVEKPQSDEALDYLRLPVSEIIRPGEEYLASMGMYVFKPAVLSDVLTGNDKQDFAKDVIPGAIKRFHVHASLFDGYWEDIGTIESFYRANLALARPGSPFRFHAPEAPIYTHPRYLAAAWLDGCQVAQSIIGDGSSLVQATVNNCVVGIRSVIRRGVAIEDTVMMGADYYETPEEVSQNRKRGIPSLGIGEGSRIKGAIIDKNARIGKNVVIANEGGVAEGDGEGYNIRDGIVVVYKDAVIPDGTVI